MRLYFQVNERNKVHILMQNTLHDSIEIAVVKNLMAPLSLAYKNYSLLRCVLYRLAKSDI